MKSVDCAVAKQIMNIKRVLVEPLQQISSIAERNAPERSYHRSERQTVDGKIIGFAEKVRARR